MIKFFIGVLVGCFIGIGLIALLSANGRSPYEDHEQDQYLKSYAKRKKEKEDNVVL